MWGARGLGPRCQAPPAQSASRRPGDSRGPASLPPAASSGSPQGSPHALRPQRRRAWPAELPARGRAARRHHRGRGLDPLCAGRSGGAGARGVHLSGPLGLPPACTRPPLLPAAGGVAREHGPGQLAIPERLPRPRPVLLTCKMSPLPPCPPVSCPVLSFQVYERNPPTPPPSSSAQGPPPHPPTKWKARPLRHTSWTLLAGVCLSSRGQALWCRVPHPPPHPRRLCLSRAHVVLGAGCRRPDAPGRRACGVGPPPPSFVPIKCGS